jgi:26S proteasome regulatory subunit T5
MSELERSPSTRRHIDTIIGSSLAQIREEIAHLDANITSVHQILTLRRTQLDQKKKETSDSTTALLTKYKPPFLVASLTELFRLDDPRDVEAFYQRETDKSAVIKTTHRDTVFLPLTGLVPTSELIPDDLIAVTPDTFAIVQKLPRTFDSRVRAMEIDSKPTETYDSLGGLDKQIQELRESIVIPLINPEKLTRLGITASKGVLLHGPPGTGKTLLARACAASTNVSFFRLAGPQLVQMYSGEGAEIVRDAFDLARSKAPAIIFIDEIDAVGGKRGDLEDSVGSREVSRTMLELLNQLDGFQPLENVKVICATNRPDTLDPALVRSGRLDRKIELPLPNEEARLAILKIHAGKLTKSDGCNLPEIARMTEDFNGAMLKAVCVEAGMLALRRDAKSVDHEDFVDGLAQVQATKKTVLEYFS